MEVTTVDFTKPSGGDPDDNDDRPGRGEPTGQPTAPVEQPTEQSEQPADAVARPIATPSTRDGELQPILADWVRDRAQLLTTTRRAVLRAAHRTTWHGVRLPLYAGRLALMAPRGVGRTARALWDVLTDGQGHGLRVTAATSGDPATWLKLRKERNERIHRRLVVTGVLLAPVALALLAITSIAALGGVLGLALGVALVRALPGVAGVALGLAGPIAGWIGLPYLIAPVPAPPTWLVVVLVAAVVGGFGWIGRPIGKPLVKPATVLAGNHGPLRAPFVMEALVSLGIPRMTKVEDIGLLFDVARVGPGYQVDLELPRGVPASAIIEKRQPLSAALRRELGTVWPSVGKRHEGHLVLYVADEPMSSAKQAPWALLKDGSVNLFTPVPLFTDQRGTWVHQSIAYTSWVVGAVPRMGKTFFVREFGLVAGLDVRAKVLAFDLKGTGDLAPLALFAHAYSVGDEPEEIAEQLEHMRWARQEMRRRAKVIRQLSHEECPENKVTDDLASRRDLGLEPIVILVDECQIWFQHADKAIKEEFTAICEDLVRRGPALGIIPLDATQKPDAKSIPTGIADNASHRVAFKVNGQVSNDQVLGTSSYKEGLRATLFALADKGVAYFKGDGADALIVRTVAGLDAPTAEKVAMRSRDARIAAGRLTGHAADEVMHAEADQAALVDDARQVLGAAAAMHLGDLVAGLGLLRPGIYGHLDNSTLAALLREAGVEVATVWVREKPRADASQKGVKREWLDVSTTAVLGEGDATVVELTERRNCP